MINSISGRLFKNDEMQGARILRNETYIHYAVMTPVFACLCVSARRQMGRTGRKDEAQHSRSRF